MKKVIQARKIRRNILGTGKRPRIVVFASNRYTYAQAVDDVSRRTLTAFSSLVLLKSKDREKKKKVEEAREVGLELAKILQKKKITQVIFDRNRYRYLGRVKALAEGLREGGLQI